jgi:thymidine kinase
MNHHGSNQGWIELITGSMFSGKTDELIKRVEKADLAGETVQVYKPVIDDRYGDEIIGAHNGRSWEAKPIDTENLETLDAGVDVVAIDEANFFPDQLVEKAQTLADNGVRVIVSGTDQTFRGEPWSPVPELCAAAEYVDKLRAVCACDNCGRPATRNQRLIDGEPAHKDDPTVMVGAEESYEARCRECHTLRTD